LGGVDKVMGSEAVEDEKVKKQWLEEKHTLVHDDC
jgi:hypothetical protein